MKKDIKTELTKEKILTAALHEFGTKGYDNATLNNICNDNGISKGLIYHNFKNKDEIYLQCVEYCMDSIVEFMKSQPIKDDLHNYMSMRYRFFTENPLLNQIFFEAILQPPKQLIRQIEGFKKEFDELNLSIYQAALEKMTLRQNVTKQEAISYYSFVQEAFNGYFRSPAYEPTSFSDLVSNHESMLKKMLDLMLYGIVKEENK